MDRYRITFQTWNEIATAYQDKFMDLDLYDDSYDRFCTLLTTERARVLEIGCGPGNVTRYMLSRRPDLDITGIDIAPNMVNLARINNPQATFRVMDCRDLHQLDELYDAVVCGFCLPYLSAPDSRRLLKQVARLLAPEGLLYCSAIEGDYRRSGFITGSSGLKTYIYYYRESDLRHSLEASGFEVQDLIRKAYTKEDGSAETHLLFLARSGRQPPW